MSRKSLMEVITQLAGPPAQLGQQFDVNALALVQQQLQLQSLFQQQQHQQQQQQHQAAPPYFDQQQVSDYYLHHMQQQQSPATQKTSETSSSLAGSSGGGKKRINRGRAFKIHKGAYNVIVNGSIHGAEHSLEYLRQELSLRQVDMNPIIVNNMNICQRLMDTVDLLPYLNNPSHCGAIIAGHLFPRDFFINHILRDTDGNVKAAKGFINHSNREPLSREASKLFFDVLFYFGGVIIEPNMLESWLWVARKGVNDRGNTSKSGRGVRYFVKPDYVPVLPFDVWHTQVEEPSPSTTSTTASSSSSPMPMTPSSFASFSSSAHSEPVEQKVNLSPKHENEEFEDITIV